MMDSEQFIQECRGAILDQTSPVPLYHQLRLVLVDLWRSRFGADDDLPTERDIIEQFHVSRITVRRALDEMIADGVIHRPRSRGRLRFAPQKMKQQLNRLYGFFSDDALAAGHHPNTRVLSVTQGVWHEANRLLQLDNNARCYRIARLHESDGQPLSHQVSFIPTNRCPDLILSDLSSSILQMMELRYGFRAQHAEQRVAARETTTEEASLLGLPLRSYIFEVDRISFNQQGEAIEYFVSILDIARYEFHTSFGCVPTRSNSNRKIKAENP